MIWLVALCALVGGTRYLELAVQIWRQQKLAEEKTLTKKMFVREASLYGIKALLNHFALLILVTNSFFLFIYFNKLMACCLNLTAFLLFLFAAANTYHVYDIHVHLF